MRKFVLGAFVAVAATASTAAQAEEADGTGFYVAANVGSAGLKDPTITYYDVGGTFNGTGTQDTASARLDTKSAITFGGTLGYDFGTIRSDVEVAYSRHKIDSLTFVALNGAGQFCDAGHCVIAAPDFEIPPNDGGASANVPDMRGTWDPFASTFGL